MATAFDTGTITPDTEPSNWTGNSTYTYNATTLNDEEWPGRGVLVVYASSYSNIGVTQVLHSEGHVYVRKNATTSTWNGWYELDRTAV